jgi:prepilin-type N-terminal cleavage/methylation domain-containing protein
MKTPSRLQGTGRARTLVRAGAGYTLVEISIVVALLAIVVSAVMSIGVSSDRTYRTGTTAAHLEAQVETALARVVAELQVARRTSLTPDPLPGVGASSIEYVRPIGITNGVVQWSPTRRLALELEPGEIANGIDDNGNGLVDEKRLVLTEDVGGPSEHKYVITRWVRNLAAGEIANGADDNGNGLVDEPGFVVERFDETLVIRLTLERRDGEGRLRARAASTSVRMRN